MLVKGNAFMWPTWSAWSQRWRKDVSSTGSAIHEVIQPVGKQPAECIITSGVASTCWATITCSVWKTRQKTCHKEVWFVCVAHATHFLYYEANLEREVKLDIYYKQTCFREFKHGFEYSQNSTNPNGFVCGCQQVMVRRWKGKRKRKWKFESRRMVVWHVVCRLVKKSQQYVAC